MVINISHKKDMLMTNKQIESQTYNYPISSTYLPKKN
jgi:hypothetical protein